MPKERLTCSVCIFCEVVRPQRDSRVICWRPYDGPEIVDGSGGLCGYEVWIEDDEGRLDMTPGEAWKVQHDRSQANLEALLPKVKELMAKLSREGGR